MSKPNFWKRDDFRSASKLYGEDPFGTKLSGANLDGATMPDGTIHD